MSMVGIPMAVMMGIPVGMTLLRPGLQVHHGFHLGRLPDLLDALGEGLQFAAQLFLTLVVSHYGPPKIGRRAAPIRRSAPRSAARPPPPIAPRIRRPAADTSRQDSRFRRQS